MNASFRHGSKPSFQFGHSQYRPQKAFSPQTPVITRTSVKPATWHLELQTLCIMCCWSVKVSSQGKVCLSSGSRAVRETWSTDWGGNRWSTWTHSWASCVSHKHTPVLFTDRQRACRARGFVSRWVLLRLVEPNTQRQLTTKWAKAASASWSSRYRVDQTERVQKYFTGHRARVEPLRGSLLQTDKLISP